MRIYILLFVVIASFGLSNCGKKSEPAPNARDLLIRDNWAPVALKFSLKLEPELIVAFLPEQIKTILDEFADIDLLANSQACEKDNRYQFRPTGKYVILDEGVKCPDFQPQEGDWKLSNDFKLFTLTPQALGGVEIPTGLPFNVNEVFTDMDVIELTAQKFQVKKSSTQKLEGVTIPGLPVQIPISLKFEVDFSFKR